MKNPVLTPDEMQVITNIQGMRAMINPDYYDSIKDFQQLQYLSLEALRTLQGNLIPKYNKAVLNHKKR